MRYATFVRFVLPVILLCTAFSLACGKHSGQGLKRYPFNGRIVLIVKANQTAIIDGDGIPGFLVALALHAKIKFAAAGKQLAARDFISAEVVVAQVNRTHSVPDYCLEN